MRNADWLTEDRARVHGTLICAAMLTFSMMAQISIFLPAFRDPHWWSLASDFDPFWSGARLALQGRPNLAYDLPTTGVLEASGAHQR